MSNLLELTNTTTYVSVTWTKITSASGTAGTTQAQSTYVDLGTPRAEQMLVRLQLQAGANPTAGQTVDIYVGYSTTTNAFPANLSGADTTWTGYTNDPTTSASKLQWVGSIVMGATTAVQVADIGLITPYMQFAAFCCINNMTTTISAATLTILPIYDNVI